MFSRTRTIYLVGRNGLFYDVLCSAKKKKKDIHTKSMLTVIMRRSPMFVLYAA